MAQRGSEQTQYDTRAELLKTLMSHVQEANYPSTTHLDMIEELLTEKERPEYVQMLIGFIDDARYPSIPMLARVKKFT